MRAARSSGESCGTGCRRNARAMRQKCNRRRCLSCACAKIVTGTVASVAWLKRVMDEASEDTASMCGLVVDVRLLCMMCGQARLVALPMAAWVDLHGDAPQARLRMEEGVAHLLGHLRARVCRQILIYRDMQVGVQRMPQPAHADIMDIDNTGHGGGCLLDLVHHHR